MKDWDKVSCPFCRWGTHIQIRSNSKWPSARTLNVGSQTTTIKDNVNSWQPSHFTYVPIFHHYCHPLGVYANLDHCPFKLDRLGDLRRTLFTNRFQQQHNVTCCSGITRHRQDGDDVVSRGIAAWRGLIVWPLGSVKGIAMHFWVCLFFQATLLPVSVDIFMIAPY
jgi:hypothetical protein